MTTKLNQINLTQYAISVMQAYLNGLKIEGATIDLENWIETDQPSWNWGQCKFRVKENK